MSELTDQHLLAAWAERRDEAAFRSLLGRYAGFVYGVTLRRTADAGLAEEISQDVFARLAQNAHRLTDHPTLAGWLHRSAMIITLDRLRRRTRHSQKLERFTQMNTQPGRDPWADAAPHLDEALDRLATRDREVLMLHFIEQRTFPEIAARLGGSADAVRMRTNRALAELARLLGKKGTIIPAAALAAGLSTATAAPPSLLVLAPAALAGAGKVSALSVIIHALQTMKLAKAAAVTALALVLATPLIFQQQQIAAAEARIAGIQRNRAPDLVSQAREKPQELAANTKASHGIDIKQLGEVALEAKDNMTDGFLAKQRIRAVVARLDANNLTGLIEVVLQGGMIRTQREALLQELLAELRIRDPGQFLTWTCKVLTTLLPDGEVGLQSSNFASQFRSSATSAFREWVAVKPDAAEAWVALHSEEWKILGRNGVGLETLLVGGLLTSVPKRAYAKLETMSPDHCSLVLSDVRDSLTAEQIESLSQWALALRDSEKRRQVLFQTIIFASMDVARDARLEAWGKGMLKLPFTDDDRAWMGARMVMASATMFQKEITKAEVEWVEKNIPSSRQTYVKGAIAHLFPPPQALIELGKQLDQAPSDDLIAGYVESDRLGKHGMGSKPGRHGDTAFKLATRTNDPTRRIELLVRAWTDLHKDSAKAAQEILETPELMQADRELLVERIAPLLEKKL